MNDPFDNGNLALQFADKYVSPIVQHYGNLLLYMQDAPESYWEIFGKKNRNANDRVDHILGHLNRMPIRIVDGQLMLAQKEMGVLHERLAGVRSSFAVTQKSSNKKLILRELDKMLEHFATLITALGEKNFLAALAAEPPRTDVLRMPVRQPPSLADVVMQQDHDGMEVTAAIVEQWKTGLRLSSPRMLSLLDQCLIVSNPRLRSIDKLLLRGSFKEMCEQAQQVHANSPEAVLKLRSNIASFIRRHSIACGLSADDLTEWLKNPPEMTEILISDPNVSALRRSPMDEAKHALLPYWEEAELVHNNRVRIIPSVSKISKFLIADNPGTTLSVNHIRPFLMENAYDAVTRPDDLKTALENVMSQRLPDERFSEFREKLEALTEIYRTVQAAAKHR